MVVAFSPPVCTFDSKLILTLYWKQDKKLMSKIGEAEGNPCVFKGNIGKEKLLDRADQISHPFNGLHCLLQRIPSALEGVKKILYSREIFLTFVILMINLFPKHKFVFYNRHAQETILLFGKCYILHYSSGFLTHFWPSTASKLVFFHLLPCQKSHTLLAVQVLVLATSERGQSFLTTTFLD